MLSSEVYPFARTGGLGDMVGSLPLALYELGHDVRIIMPRYKNISDEFSTLKPIIQEPASPLDNPLHHTTVWEDKLMNRVTIYFLDAPVYFNRSELYGTSHGDYLDNAERFSFFNRAALEAIKVLSFQPDIIQCHDWQNALVPVYLKTLYKNDPFFQETQTLLTIHNMGYQGLFSSTQFSLTGLPQEVFSTNGLEFFGKVNFLKGGLYYADRLNTVSPTYSEEIQTSEFGCGLEGVLQERRKGISGILNGLNVETWDPERDGAIFEPYTLNHLKGKTINKEGLQRQQGLSIKKNSPIIGMVTRLASQKGLDLVLGVLDDLMKRDLQLIILGTGEDRYQKRLLQFSLTYPDKTRVIIGFNDTQARQVYAGSDFFLMPSLYEPCGIGQLISLRYGTIPIVRKTGGLADTVEEFNPITGEGHGFLFQEYSPKSLLEAMDQALTCYQNPHHRNKMISNAMKLDFSWRVSAGRYSEIYDQLSQKK